MTDSVSVDIAADDAARKASVGKPSVVAPLQVPGYQPSMFTFAGSSESMAAFTPAVVSMADRKSMRRDPQIVLGLAAFRAPLKNIARYYIEGRDPEIARAARAAFENTLPAFIGASLESVEFGFSFSEVLWEHANIDIQAPQDAHKGAEMRKLYRPLVPRSVDPERVELLVDTSGAFVGATVGATQGVVAGTSQVPMIPAGQSYLVTYRGDWGNLYGESILDPAYVPWKYSAVIRKLWGRFLEKFAMGIFLGRVPEAYRTDADGNRQDLIGFMNAILSNVRGAGAVTLPYETDANGKPSFDVQMLETSREGRAFSEAVTFFEAQKLRAILVPERTVTQDTLTGSHSMASAHADLFLLMLDEVMDEQILQPFSDQILVPWTRLNYGPTAAPPRLRASRLSREARSMMFEVLKAAIAAPIRTQDGKVYTPAALIDLPRMLEQLSIPHRSVEETATEDPLSFAPSDGESPAQDTTPAQDSLSLSAGLPTDAAKRLLWVCQRSGEAHRAVAGGDIPAWAAPGDAEVVLRVLGDPR